MKAHHFTRHEIIRVTEGGKSVTIPARSRVIPARNLPADSPIKYWLDYLSLPEAWYADPEIESHARNIGFGFSAMEVTNR